MARKPTIIPIAGGKGGIGKSVILSGLAISLAKMGYPTVAVDLDLGGSNLHTMLGHQNRYPAIGDFLMKKDKDLSDYLVETDWPALQFIAGDGRTPFMANLNSGHKAKLLRQLQQLPARYVLLDLGAGTSYNTLDFFRIAPVGLVVTTPERPALMNMLTFLKNVLFRNIERQFRQHPTISKRLQEMFAEPITAEKITVERIRDEVESFEKGASRKVDRICKAFKPRIIINIAQHPNDLDLLNNVAVVLRDILSVEIVQFGFIFDDPTVRTAIREGVPLLEYAPDCHAAKGIDHLAVRIARMWDAPLLHSDERLKKYAWKFYEVAIADDDSKSGGDKTVEESMVG